MLKWTDSGVRTIKDTEGPQAELDESDSDQAGKERYDKPTFYFPTAKLN